MNRGDYNMQFSVQMTLDLYLDLCLRYFKNEPLDNYYCEMVDYVFQEDQIRYQMERRVLKGYDVMGFCSVFGVGKLVDIIGDLKNPHNYSESEIKESLKTKWTEAGQRGDLEYFFKHLYYILSDLGFSDLQARTFFGVLNLLPKYFGTEPYMLWYNDYIY